VKTECDQEKSPSQKVSSPKAKAKHFIPSSLSKTPNLDHLITRFLVLQFGEERVLNVSPLTEMAKKSDNEGHMLLWNLKIDDEEAAVSVNSDGSTWVNFFSVLTFSMLGC
jgi:hypothetical protein